MDSIIQTYSRRRNQKGPVQRVNRQETESWTNLHEKTGEKAAAANAAETTAADVAGPDPAGGRGRRKVLQACRLQPARHDGVPGVPRGG